MSRPREFDEAKALAAAVDSFWQHGYEATSVRDLSAAMGISGASLYNAFGDKRELFAKALDQYCRTRTHRLIAQIESTYEPVAAISHFFAEIIDRSVSDRSLRGCLLINSAVEVAPHDAELRASIRKHLSEIRSFFLRSLKGASSGRTARTVTEREAQADHLMAVLLGIRVLARSRPERALLEGIVDIALSSVGLEPLRARNGSAALPAERLGRAVRLKPRSSNRTGIGRSIRRKRKPSGVW